MNAGQELGALPGGGTVRPITRWGDSVMHRPAAAIETFDAELTQLVADLVATMRAAEGVGLAATQVGVGLRVFVFECPDDEHRLHRGVVCNPVLSLPPVGERRLVEQEEGCLSLPGAFAPCARPDLAVVHGVDHLGRQIRYEGTGMLARCLQHETDHLDGTVFGDRLPRRVRKHLQADADAMAEQFPPSWPVRVPAA